MIFLLLLIVTVAVHVVFQVPYVPSRRKAIEKMLAVAKLKSKEMVFDLGCGDGRLLLAAEKKARVKTMGFEVAPLVYLLAILRKFLARSSAKIQFKSLFHANFAQANVIFCYLIPSVMPQLAIKLKKECRRGTRIISNTFHIPGLKPSKVFARDKAKGLPTIYLYEM